MAALPINPQLSKVLLDGIEAGVGTEAIFTVALSSLSSSVFFRGGSDEMKLASDKKKLQFVHKMGDQMTNLSVYQSWLEQNKDKRKQWCVQNYVNAKSMRIVEEAVKELGHILRQRLHKNVSLKLMSLDEAKCFIPKLFFDAFLNNLSVYLGHESAGYLFSEASGIFQIFPGSSMKQLNSTPKYVLFERTLKTSQQFLTQVMHVEEVWVEEAVKSGRLLQDPAERFRAYMVKPVDIVAVGPHTYSKAMYDHKSEISEKFSSINSSQFVSVSPTLDYSLSSKQWGVIRVFSLLSDHEKVRTVVTQCTSQVQEDLKRKTKEYGITKKDDDVRVLLGTGGVTKQVVMPHQFRTVLAQGPHSGEWVAEVKRLMQSFGNVTNESFKQEDSHYCLFITYETPEEAQQAVVNCRYPNVVVLPSKAILFTLKVQWQRRERSNFANIYLDSPDHVQRVLRCFEIAKLGGFGGVWLAQLTLREDKHSEKQIFIIDKGKILNHIDEAHLCDRIAAVLNGTDIQFRLRMGHMKCDTTSEEYENYKEELAHIISQYANLGEYFIDFPELKQTSINFEAYIKFVNPDIGFKVLKSKLTRETIGLDMKPLSVTAPLQTKLIIRREIFDLIEMTLEEHKQRLLKCFSTGLQIRIWKQNYHNKNTSCIIIRSNDVRIFVDAQNAVNAVAQPLVIQCKNPELQQYIISSVYQEQIKAIQVNTCTYIWTDKRDMTINIYGTKENMAKANTQIEQATKVLFSGGAMQVKLSLKGRQHPPGVMKYLVSRYGNDLEGLLQIDGVRVITLDHRKHVISLLATSKGQEAVKKCIGEFSPPTLMAVEQTGFEVECSACLTQIETPEELIRLEHCGHAYHTLCIEQQLTPNSIVFPVECAAKGCSQDLVLQDFENVQKKCHFRMQELISQSIRDYMGKNSQEIKSCPTPDCQMIYITTSTDTGKPFLCSHCGVATCTKCHKQYHGGISCEMYKSGENGDELLKKWMQKNLRDRKHCPNCKAPIEKHGGCNHVTCAQCKTDICWLCLKVFISADECYEHTLYCPRNQ